MSPCFFSCDILLVLLLVLINILIYSIFRNPDGTLLRHFGRTITVVSAQCTRPGKRMYPWHVFLIAMSGRTLDNWAKIKLDDKLVENEARAQIQRKVQSLIRGVPLPWMTVELTPQPVETLVMDVLQQVCHYGAFNR